MPDQRVNGNLVLIGSLGGTFTLGCQASGGGFTYLLPTTIPQIGQSLVVASVFNGNTATLQWGPSFTTTAIFHNIIIGGTLADNSSSVGTNGQVLTSTGSGVLWQTPATAVVSVFGRSGAVVAQSGDYSYAQISGTPQLAQTKAAVTNQWLNSYSATTGLFTSTQPAFTNLSGSIATGQIPAATVTVTQINATGTPSVTTFLRGDGTWAVPSSTATALATTGSPVVVSTAASPTGAGQVLTSTSTTAANWQTPSAGSRVASISYVIDGGGSAPSTGAKGQVSIPAACTLTGWVITADVSGSAVVDVLRSTYAGFPTTASIAGTDKPTLASVQKNQDLTLTGWGSTAISAGDQIQFNLNSVTTCTRLNITLNVTIP